MRAIARVIVIANEHVREIAIANDSVTCALRAHVFVDMCIVFVDVFSTYVYLSLIHI